MNRIADIVHMGLRPHTTIHLKQAISFSFNVGKLPAAGEWVDEE